ncbi:MAG: hypothetical protein F4X64_16150 [Chloroflexi bacterium]|nr:hypothetical protein [Chloroflexota bacterium]
MMHDAYQGDGYELVSVPITSSLASELRVRAGESGIDVAELILDLFIAAFRNDLERICPTFTVSDDFAADFVSDGFRVVARQDGLTTLCPFDAIPFERAISEFRELNLTDDEILRVARS